MKINLAHIACIYCFIFGIAVENFRQYYNRERNKERKRKGTE